MIFLKTMRGKTFFVNKDAADILFTPRQILERLYDLSKLDIGSFRLVFTGQEVKDELLDQNVVELGWVHGTVVHIIGLSPEANEFLATMATNIEVAPRAAGFHP